MKRWLPWLALALAAIACFAATIGYDFAYDDKQIAMSPLLSRPWDFLAVLRNRYYPANLDYLGLYRPLSQWPLLLNWRLNEALFSRGDIPWTFHAVNVLLHAATSLLLLAWLRSLALSEAVAFTAALLFAVHPIHSEAIANVTGRSEPQALAFGLAFLLAHRAGRAPIAAAAFLAALWSKESAVTVLPLAIAADRLFPSAGGRPGTPDEAPHGWRLGSRYGVYAVVAAAWLLLRALALRDTHPSIAYADNPVAYSPALVRVLTAAAVQLEYLRLQLIPIGQSTDYAYAETRPVDSVLDLRVIGFLLLVAGAFALAGRLRRRAPVVPLCVLGYALFFSTTSNLVVPIGTILAERLAYAPSIFVCLLAAEALWRLRSSVGRAVPIAMVIALSAAGAWATVRQNRVWRDEKTLMLAGVVTAPESAKAHRNLGVYLQGAGDLEGAEREFARSASIHRGYGWTWFLLGNVRHRLGRTESAIAAWRTALEVDSRLVDVHVNISAALLELGLRPEAVAEVRILFAKDPFHTRLAGLQDRLAESASPQEIAEALSALDAADRALSAGDLAKVLDLSQRAVTSGALTRPGRARALSLLASGWRGLGQPDRARGFQTLAAGLSAPETPPDPASR